MPPADTNRPRRPLSAYNLFYRYKRAKIIEATAKCACNSKEAICELVATPPGVEHYAPHVVDMISEDERRSNIRCVLQEQLFAKDTRNRSHTKSGHGYKMTFVEMNKIMVNTWKETDEFAKGVFQELADEAREEYQQRMNEYEKDGGKRTKKVKPVEGPNLKKPKVIFEPSRQVSVPSPTEERALPLPVAPRSSSKVEVKGLPLSMEAHLGGSKIDFSLEPLPFFDNHHQKNKNGASISPASTSPPAPTVSMPHVQQFHNGALPSMPPVQIIHNGAPGGMPLMPSGQGFHNGSHGGMPYVSQGQGLHNRTPGTMRSMVNSLQPHHIGMKNFYQARRQVSVTSPGADSISPQGSYQKILSPMWGDSCNTFPDQFNSGVQPPTIFLEPCVAVSGAYTGGSIRGDSLNTYHDPFNSGALPPPVYVESGASVSGGSTSGSTQTSASSDSRSTCGSLQASVSSDLNTPEDYFMELISTLDLP